MGDELREKISEMIVEKTNSLGKELGLFQMNTLRELNTIKEDIKQCEEITGAQAKVLGNFLETLNRTVNAVDLLKSRVEVVKRVEIPSKKSVFSFFRK